MTTRNLYYIGSHMLKICYANVCISDESGPPFLPGTGPESILNMHMQIKQLINYSSIINIIR